MKYFLTIALLMSALLGCTSVKTPLEKPEFYLGGFDGVWIGNIQQVKGSGYPFIASGEHEMAVMLIIKEDTVKLFTGSVGETLKEVKYNKFNIVRHKTNAVIYAQDSESTKYNEEDMGDWAETWNMTLTRKDDGSIYVYLVRAVNNFRMAAETNTDEETARFIFSWSGELTHMASLQRIED